MINLRMYGEKWQIIIGDEIWEFPTKTEFDANLKVIIDIKEKYGQRRLNDKRNN